MGEVKRNQKFETTKNEKAQKLLSIKTPKAS